MSAIWTDCLLKISRLRANRFNVGLTILVEYDLMNQSKKSIKLGKYSACIACRDPNYKNRVLPINSDSIQ